MSTIKTITINVIKDAKERAFEFDTIEGQDIHTTIVLALEQIKPNTIMFPILATDVDNKVHNIELNSNIADYVVEACNQLTINVLGKDMVITMNNQTNNTMNTEANEVKLTAEEWAKVCIQEATQFVNDNGTPAIKEALNNADESTILDRLQRAVDVTSQSCGKACDSIKTNLSAAYTYCKAKGGTLLSTIKTWAMYIWRKVSAAVVGLGYFTMHTTKIVFNHTIAMSKEIYNAFNEDVVQRVKNA